jgi:hypothetical protein
MHRFRHRTLLGRVSLAALLPLLASAGCGGSGSEPTSTPPPAPPPPPVRVVVVTAPTVTGGPYTLAGEFVVRVEDAAGRGVRGVRVNFRSQSGRPGFIFTPADTMTSDSTGVARAGVKFGVIAGADRLMATAAGVADPALVDVTVMPGPPTFTHVSPSSMRLFVGDSASFQAFVTDGFLNVIPNFPLDFKVSDPTLLSVTSPTTPTGRGMVRALRTGGSATITSAVTNLSITLSVSVFPSPRDACAGVAPPQDLALGVVTPVAGSAICLAPNARGSEYALVVYNESTDGATSLGTTVTGYNVLPEMLPNLMTGGTRPSLSRTATLRRRSSTPKLDLRFHERLLEQNRSLRRLFAPARTARSIAQRGTADRIGGPRLSYSLGGSRATVPAVDDLIALNVATASCSNADMRTFRVEAVGSKAIVLADTANPADGFVRTDYQRFAARFDTLVYPLDRDAFGEPSDIDANGRVAILFTRAVNELTPANSGAFVGGFFHARDLFPRTQSPTFDVCPTSNEGELFYMMVPDPAGTVNGNQFSLGMVDTLTTGVLAHELQHLINASRRMYVNTAATEFEETWLNEGLSHTAEELLFFRESGYSPRSRLMAQSITDTWAHFNAWVSNDASNFVNFYLYLRDPANHSPIDAGDALETRGATWAFLRHAVDKSFDSDAGVWQRFGNSTTTGVGTLAFGLQRDPKALLRDFAVTNMNGGHPSWHFASVYSQVFVGLAYPLPFGLLEEATAVPVAARGGSASYYRFAVPPDAQTLLKFGSGAAPPNGNLTFLLVRTGFKPN